MRVPEQTPLGGILTLRSIFTKLDPHPEFGLEALLSGNGSVEEGARGRLRCTTAGGPVVRLVLARKACHGGWESWVDVVPCVPQVRSHAKRSAVKQSSTSDIT